MDKVKIFAKLGIGLATLDILIRFFGPLYTTVNSVGSFGVLIIPAFAVVISLAALKAKKWSLYGSIILAILSLVTIFGVRDGDLSGEAMLAIIYLIVYGLLAYLGLKESKNFN